MQNYSFDGEKKRQWYATTSALEISKIPADRCYPLFCPPLRVIIVTRFSEVLGM